MTELLRQVEILRAACCIAGLDGNVDDAERAILERLAREVGVGQASLHAMIERARTDRNFYTAQFRVLKADPESTIRTLFAVAVADSALTQDERVILAHFADRLGMTSERFAEVLADAERDKES